MKMIFETKFKCKNIPLKYSFTLKNIFRRTDGRFLFGNAGFRQAFDEERAMGMVP